MDVMTGLIEWQALRGSVASVSARTSELLTSKSVSTEDPAARNWAWIL
jgi:hypothetical protein